MIILDTNVVSEMMKTAPSGTVLDWLNGQDAASLYVTTITLAEIGYGLRLLPEGQRRRLLAERFERFIAVAFDQRILSFDEVAARLWRYYGTPKGTRAAHQRHRWSNRRDRPNPRLRHRDSQPERF